MLHFACFEEVDLFEALLNVSGIDLQIQNHVCNINYCMYISFNNDYT